MSDEPDVEPEQLQRELSQIKEAMGLAERYPGQRRTWLVAGVAVGLTAILTNVFFVLELPPVAYVAAWFAMVAVIGGAQWRLVSETPGESTADGFDWRVLVGGLLLALVALWSALGTLIGENTAGALQGAHYFSHVVLFMGLGFFLAGNALRTYRIRRRDRIPFYLGGVWMFGLAAAVPHVRVLRFWGYAVFGVLFLAHSIGTYLLTSPD